jgi:hypothetical protein
LLSHLPRGLNDCHKAKRISKIMIAITVCGLNKNSFRTQVHIPMPPKCRRSDKVLQEEVGQHKDKNKIKRRKRALTVDSQPKTTVKKAQQKALCNLLTQNATVVTNVKLENTREMSRLTKLVRSHHSLSCLTCLCRWAFYSFVNTVVLPGWT